MSLLYLGSSFLDDEMKEGVVVQLKDDSRSNGMINSFDFETDFEFWPIQHPTEPSHEDRPVQCPIPHSSPLLKDERMQDDRSSERKKPVIHRENGALQAKEPAIRTVRKRHHDHTNTITPLLQSLPGINMTVFNQVHSHRFES